MTLYENALRKAAEDAGGAFEGKNVLVTGATGLVGKALVDCLTLDGKTAVYAASRSKQSFDARFKERENLKYFEFDLLQPVKNAPKFDYIIHAASNADPKMFDKDPVGTMTANFMGTYNLLELVRKMGGRLIYISSGEVYGQYDGACEAFCEDYAGYVNFSEARGCYPTAKRAAENLLVCYNKQYGTDGVIVRLSHTYGPTQLERDSRASSEFFRLASRGDDIIMRSLGETVRSYTCVFDAVSAILTAAARGKSGEAYNVANTNSAVSIAELAKTIAEAAGRKVVFEIGEVKGAGKIARGVLDASKLEKLGWRARYDLKDGVKITLDIMGDRHE
ncbi:MAG: NAD-dependent epimerase/dehydratase family protein [Clostridia bacterium]|nr:NAD-dependent epimerase/dehydratase family protein [Clostridia bacterium]